MKLSTFSLHDIKLQNAETTPSQMLTLSGGDVTRSTDALTLIIVLSTSYLNQLKARDAILDLANNGLHAAIHQVDVFIPDDTALEIVSFLFDLNVGLLNLAFSEAINISTFDPTRITLQNSQTLDEFSVAITGCMESLVSYAITSLSFL
ncbi:MAG: hypothetical protein OXU61_01045 [Gammaproteobacteria bacterium]|nr:hypothetical protein [Gammaproteobacteria bacterium]